MSQSTFYPAMDGYVRNSQAGSAWSTVRAASSGTAADTSSTDELRCFVDSGSVTQGSTTYVDRGFLTFDTSSLPDDAIVTAVTLKLTPTAIAASTSAGGNVCVVGSTPASNTSLGTSDFNKAGTTEYASRQTYAGFSVGTTRSITLNASGIAAISLTGYTKIGLRADFDIDNSEPLTGGSAKAYWYVVFKSVENATTANRPQLVVDYTVPASRTAADTWSWSDTASGVAFHTIAGTAGDTWAWSDSVVRLTGKTAGDTWAWSDTTGRGTAGARTAGTERTVWAANEGGWAHYQFGVVCRTANGKLLAVCRRGTNHGSYDGSIVSKTSSDDGATWGNASVIVDGASTGWDERDPKVVKLSSGRLVLVWKGRKAGNGTTNPYWYCHTPQFAYSDDNGATWSTPVGITHNKYEGTVSTYADDSPSDIVELDSPSHLLAFGYGAQDSTNNTRFDLWMSESTDGGATWTAKATPATWADAGNYNAVEPQAVRLETGVVLMTWHRESSPQKWYVSTALTPYTSWSHTQQPLWSLNRQGLSLVDYGRGVIVSGVTDSTGQYWYEESRNYGVTFNSKTQVNPTYDSGVTWPTWIMSVALGGTGDTQNVGFIYSEEKASTQDQGSVKYRQFSGLNGVFVYSRTAGDTWAWSDSTSTQFSRSRTATDTWAWTDSPARSRTSSRTPADTWAWSDAAGRAAAATDATAVERRHRATRRPRRGGEW